MRDCTVSVTSPKDGGRTHTVEVTASSKLDAAAQAIESWSRLWWWEPDLVLEVKCGDLQWRVAARRAQAWPASWKRAGELAMKDCTVSVVSPKDGETHTVELTASNLFNAAEQAVEAWSRFWWWEPDLMLKVKCGDKYWKIRAGWKGEGE